MIDSFFWSLQWSLVAGVLIVPAMCIAGIIAAFLRRRIISAGLCAVYGFCAELAYLLVILLFNLIELDPEHWFNAEYKSEFTYKIMQGEVDAWLGLTGILTVHTLVGLLTLNWLRQLRNSEKRQ